jgi:hypothetical protein
MGISLPYRDLLIPLKLDFKSTALPVGTSPPYHRMPHWPELLPPAQEPPASITEPQAILLPYRSVVILRASGASVNISFIQSHNGLAALMQAQTEIPADAIRRTVVIPPKAG